MTNTGQPPTIEERLSRLENLFTSIGETVVSHDGTIDVLVANVNQLTENVNRLNNSVDVLAIQVSTQAAEAAADRQQAAIDRQEFRNGINRILQYLSDRNGGSSPPA